ncbi:MAG: hypothetical protein ACTSUY_04945, partial [Alphaproteobacteria bacterium]
TMSDAVAIMTGAQPPPAEMAGVTVPFWCRLMDFISTIQRIRANQTAVAVPIFDRAADLARAGAVIVDQSHTIVLTEGNYLGLAKDPWQQLHDLFDLRILVDVPLSELSARLTNRWRTLGVSVQETKKRVETHDLVNAALVRDFSNPPDICFDNC